MILLKTIGILWIFFINVHTIIEAYKGFVYKKDRNGKNIMNLAHYIPAYDSDETKYPMGLFLSDISEYLPKPERFVKSSELNTKPKQAPKPKLYKRFINKLIKELTFKRDPNEDVDKEKVKSSILNKNYYTGKIKSQPMDNVVIVLLDQNKNFVDSDVDEYKNRKESIDKDIVAFNLDDSKEDQKLDMRFASDYYEYGVESNVLRNGLLNEKEHKRSQISSSGLEKLENEDQLDKVILDLEDYKRRENMVVNEKEHKRSQVSTNDLEKLENVQDKFDEVILDLEDYKKMGNKLNARKRLLYDFLPKRYYWADNDLTKLGYFWYNGPQGKFPGPYRITY